MSGGCRPGYLCTWMDLFTRVIVSWSVDDNMQESLVREPLEKALLKRKIQPGLIIHSDRGGQYLSDKMKELVHTFGLKQSMSKADDPYDNTFAESLWSRLKTELESKPSINPIFQYLYRFTTFVKNKKYS